MDTFELKGHLGYVRIKGTPWMLFNISIYLVIHSLGFAIHILKLVLTENLLVFVFAVLDGRQVETGLVREQKTTRFLRQHRQNSC